MSPLRITSIISAASMTLLTIFTMVVSRVVHQDVLPADAVDLLVALTSVLWICYLVAHCRDQVLRRLDGLIDRVDMLETAIGEYGDSRATDGRLSAMRLLAEEQKQGPNPGDRLRSVPR